MKILISLIVVLASTAALAMTHPVGSNTSQPPAGPLCMAHISHIDAMLDRGLTKEQILADFEQWLAAPGRETPADKYPGMVRTMIASAREPGWPEDAYRACIDAFKAH